MAKRKRGSIHERSADIGLGATLSFLKGGEAASSDARTAVEDDDDDDEGWTTVGAPKKKRKQLALEEEHRPSSSHRSDGNRRNSPANPADFRSGQDPKQPASSAHTASSDERSFQPTNPFAKETSAGDRASPPSNPFSTKKQSRDQGTPKPAEDLSARDEGCVSKQERGDGGAQQPLKPSSSSQNGSGDTKKSKEERGKERKLERNYPAIEHSHHARLQSPVKITDLQSLILYLLADGSAPQWVSVRSRMSINQVVVLMVPGLELGMFNGDVALESASRSRDKADSEKSADGCAATDGEGAKPRRIHVTPDDFYPASLKSHRLPTALQPLADVFPHVWPIKAQGEHRSHQYVRLHSPIHTMLTSQIPKTREEKQMKKQSNHKGPLPQNNRHWENKRTRVTEYLANLAEQQENEYVLHPAWFTTPESKEAACQRRKTAKQSADEGWVDTAVPRLEDGDVPEGEIEKGSVTAGRRVLAIDCEMCKSEDDQLVLTRISLLDWDGTVVLDKLVKPDMTIKDYLTQWSGITESMLRDVTTTLSDIQKELLELLTPRTILVGHSLNSDLNALQLTHPFVIDTGIIFPHARGPPYKQSLKWLSQKYLSKEIQKGANGHDSVEDARACLDLVRQKCERGPQWGTSETNSESIFRRLGRVLRPKSSNAPRAGAVIDWGEPTRGHGAQAQVAVGCKSDEEVVEGIERTVRGLATGKTGATEKVDFTWGRLRELELGRGWWDDGRTSEDVELLRQAALKRIGRHDSQDHEVVGDELGSAVSRTVGHIVKVFESLPRCTAFIVYSGTGDPREMRRLHAMQQQYRREYATKNWDNLSVKWTDTEVQGLSQACQRAREGVGFVVVK